jgi:hypothetical protein
LLGGDAEQFLEELHLPDDIILCQPVSVQLEMEKAFRR